jgi:hypothetical protein
MDEASLLISLLLLVPLSLSSLVLVAPFVGPSEF